MRQLDAPPASGRKYRISGTSTKSEVPNNFAVIVPVYVSFDKGAFVKLGDVAVIGSSTKNVDVEVALPKAPRGVTINAMHDVLSR